MKKPYFENLDALRFIAFFSVFLFHSFYTPFEVIKADQVYQFFYFFTRGGELGVNFFFVLSGFLITYLLLDEELKTGKIDVYSFYIRRILRIWPLYLLLTLFCFLIYPSVRQLFGDHPQQETGNPLFFFTFLSNYDNIYNHSNTPTLYILWSISIEEQFYLLWPLLMASFPFAKKWIPMVAIIFINLASRLHFKDNDLHLHFNSLCVTSDMAVGALLAWVAFLKKDFLNWFNQVKKAYKIVFYVLGFFLILTRSYWTQVDFLRVFERVILSLFFSFVIYDQTLSTKPLFRAGRFDILTKLGKTTYGLYCYHYLCLLFAIKINSALKFNHTVFGVVVLDNLSALLIVIIVASLSYKFFESYFLKLKSLFDYRYATLKREQVADFKRKLE